MFFHLANPSFGGIKPNLAILTAPIFTPAQQANITEYLTALTTAENISMEVLNFIRGERDVMNMLFNAMEVLPTLEDKTKSVLMDQTRWIMGKHFADREPLIEPALKDLIMYAQNVGTKMYGRSVEDDVLFKSIYYTFASNGFISTIIASSLAKEIHESNLYPLIGSSMKPPYVDGLGYILKHLKNQTCPGITSLESQASMSFKTTLSVWPNTVIEHRG